MTEKEPFISIIIVEYYYPEEKFIRCMKSYTNQDYENYEIILILWGKKEFNDISTLLKSNNIKREKIKIFEYFGDPGYAKGNNIGVNKTKSEFILISNPDVETTPNFLKKMINSFFFLKKKNNTDKIIVGPRICNYNGIIEYSRRKINFLGFGNIDISKTNKIRRTMISSGCCFIIKKKYYEKLNGFDESYFMYKEDIDFSIRAMKFGIKQYVDNSIHLYHLRSDEEYKLNKFKYYYHERNRILLCLEHSKKKKKMLLSHLLFEPIHIIFSISKDFFRERYKIYKFFFQNYFKIIKNKKNENDLFDRYYEMDGIFNETNLNSLKFKILNYFAKMLFYFYHH